MKGGEGVEGGRGGAGGPIMVQSSRCIGRRRAFHLNQNRSRGNRFSADCWRLGAVEGGGWRVVGEGCIGV